jgi:uncharacterized protein
MREKSKQQIRIWAMLCHLSALIAWVLLVCLIIRGIPLFLPLNIVAPLIIWRWKKAQDSWIDFQGKESLNFQLSLTIYALIVIIASLLLIFTTFGMALTANATGKQVKTILDSLVMVFFTLSILILLLQLILVGFASIKAYKGEHYRYPFAIKFLM